MIRVGDSTIMIDMSEQQETYKDIKDKTTSAVLNRMSIERIKRMGEHWTQCYGEP